MLCTYDRVMVLVLRPNLAVHRVQGFTQHDMRGTPVKSDASFDQYAAITPEKVRCSVVIVQLKLS